MKSKAVSGKKEMSEAGKTAFPPGLRGAGS